MKIAVAGKGGVGKTTVSGTLARALGRNGHTVLAVDADLNPMLGVSLGVGAEKTESLQAARQAVAAGILVDDQAGIGHAVDGDARLRQCGAGSTESQ